MYKFHDTTRKYLKQFHSWKMALTHGGRLGSACPHAGHCPHMVLVHRGSLISLSIQSMSGLKQLVYTDQDHVSPILGHLMWTLGGSDEEHLSEETISISSRKADLPIPFQCQVSDTKDHAWALTFGRSTITLPSATSHELPIFKW